MSWSGTVAASGAGVLASCIFASSLAVNLLSRMEPAGPSGARHKKVQKRQHIGLSMTGHDSNDPVERGGTHENVSEVLGMGGAVLLGGRRKTSSSKNWQFGELAGLGSASKRRSKSHSLWSRSPSVVVDSSMLQ